MTMRAGRKTFIDTNVVLRSRFPDMPLFTEALAAIQAEIANGSEVWISRQIIREFVVQVSHPNTLSKPLDAMQIEQHIDDIETHFHVADDTRAVTKQLIALLKEFPTAGKQVHDANIVATMLVNGIDTLITLNVSHMQRFASKVTVVSPLPST